MEFLIKLSVFTTGISLVVGTISILILDASGLYRNKKATIIVTAIVAVAIGAIFPTDYRSVGQWAYYVLPTLILMPPWVILCYRQRLKDRGHTKA